MVERTEARNGPPPDVIAAALGRALAAPDFAGSPQLSAFLRFIVTEAAAGRDERLKGYVIATEALGRGEDFDPQADPIVRVEAIRLRRALAAHYAGAGADDPVRISVPRGGYAPRFAWAGGAAPAPVEAPDPRSDRSAAALLAAAFGVVVAALSATLWPGPARPPPAPPGTLETSERATALAHVHVAPFMAEGEAAGVAERLRDRLIGALARFDDIRVTTAAPDGPSVGAPGFVLRGALGPESTETLVTLRLESERGEVAWSRIALLPAGGDGVAETGLVREAATAIAQRYGVIAAAAASGAAGDDASPQRCLAATLAYWRSYAAAEHRRVRACLERLTAARPALAEAHAALAFLYVDEVRFGFNPRRGDALTLALAAARRAVELKPQSARAAQALCGAHFARRELVASREACDRARALNPLDTDIMADAAFKLVWTGDVAAGRALLEEAAALLPAPPVWHETARGLAAHLAGDHDDALTLARRIGETEFPPAALLRALAELGAGEMYAARAAAQRLVRQQPTFGVDALGALRRWTPDETIARRLAAEFARAAPPP